LSLTGLTVACAGENSEQDSEEKYMYGRFHKLKNRFVVESFPKI